MPISLCDSELQIVLAAAEPLPPDRREQFLIDVAAALEPYRNAIGPGIVSRIAADAQRKHREAPNFHGNAVGKWDR